MTLLIGIKCIDGVVVAADGAATYSVPFGPSTTVQPTSKLWYLDGPLIMGVAGPIGLAQLFSDQIPQTLHGKLEGHVGLRGAEIQRLIGQSIFKEAEPAMQGARATGQALGHQGLAEMFMTQSIVALPVQGEPTLMQFDHVGNGEVASGDLPFVSVGSGQNLADPFLAFIRRVLWAERQPTVKDGVIAAIWTLLNAFAINPSAGIGEPIEVGVLTTEKDITKARPLTQDELGEYRQSVNDAERHLAGFLNTNEGDTPPLPKPPAAP